MVEKIATCLTFPISCRGIHMESHDCVTNKWFYEMGKMNIHEKEKQWLRRNEWEQRTWTINFVIDVVYLDSPILQSRGETHIYKFWKGMLHAKKESSRDVHTLVDFRKEVLEDSKIQE